MFRTYRSKFSYSIHGGLTNSSLQPCQSLFVAPCSHTWHYKCIRVIINGPHWPHFICPNCRSVADLEAELEDPTANGDWEEIESEDPPAPVAEPAQTEETMQSATQPQCPINDGEESRVIVEVDREGSENDISGPSDLDVAEISDDSDIGQAVTRATNSMGFIQLDDSPSPPDLREGHEIRSNATSAPVDIISRKAVGSAPSGASTRLVQPDSRTERQMTRTPSPNGFGSSLDVISGNEGPMTPRNDAGPFVFDGSAGRASGARLATMATINLAAAADSPSAEPTPNPA